MYKYTVLLASQLLTTYMHSATIPYTHVVGLGYFRSLLLVMSIVYP